MKCMLSCFPCKYSIFRKHRRTPYDAVHQESLKEYSVSDFDNDTMFSNDKRTFGKKERFSKVDPDRSHFGQSNIDDGIFHHQPREPTRDRTHRVEYPRRPIHIYLNPTSNTQSFENLQNYTIPYPFTLRESPTNTIKDVKPELTDQATSNFRQSKIQTQ